jgi:hypothetical protein
VKDPRSVELSKGSLLLFRGSIGKAHVKSHCSGPLRCARMAKSSRLLLQTADNTAASIATGMSCTSGVVLGYRQSMAIRVGHPVLRTESAVYGPSADVGIETASHNSFNGHVHVGDGEPRSRHVEG